MINSNQCSSGRIYKRFFVLKSSVNNMHYNYKTDSPPSAKFKLGFV